MVDVLGKTTTVAVPAGGAADLGIDGSPRYVRVPAGAQISIGAAQAWGENLALATKGAVATASSSGHMNPVWDINDGRSAPAARATSAAATPGPPTSGTPTRT